MKKVVILSLLFLFSLILRDGSSKTKRQGNLIAATRQVLLPLCILTLRNLNDTESLLLRHL